MLWLVIGIYFTIGLAWGTFQANKEQYDDNDSSNSAWLYELLMILIFGAIWPVMLLVVHDD